MDISTSSVSADRSLMTAAFLRDITDRQHAEALALTLHDNEVRRRHALEINDNVVQGLVSTLYLLDLGRTVDAHTAARNTLSAARTMMSDLLGDAGADAGQLQGQLVREQAHIGTLERQRTDETAPVPGALRVLLADDAEDIRLLLRLNLSSADGFEVVGEAGDGAQAVTLTAELRPDVVVLDLSMPVMDGLQAIPEMLRVCPTVRIVVLSGFDEQRLRAAAMSRGAHAYLEKGQAFTTVVDELNRLFPDRTPAQPPVRSQDMDSAASPVFDGDMVVHELRTPLTVVTGMLATLRDRMDELPSATTAELVQSALRNAQQMADLLDVLSDAGHASHGYLPVMLERADVGPLVRAAVADLCSAHGWATVPVQAADGILADVDPVRCRQVLANLLGNAVKFGISATVTVQLRGDLVEVAVSDDGPGIPADRRPNLFRKFSRLGASGPGMGLGLFISRALARAQGGDVELRDGPRTTFVLSLPVSDVTASSSATGSR